jgi:hypothetical protein
VAGSRSDRHADKKEYAALRILGYRVQQGPVRAWSRGQLHQPDLYRPFLVHRWKKAGEGLIIRYGYKKVLIQRRVIDHHNRRFPGIVVVEPIVVPRVNLVSLARRNPNRVCRCEIRRAESALSGITGGRL